jgi:chaperonin GroES
VTQYNECLGITLSGVLQCAGDIIAVGDGKVGEHVQEFYLQPGQTILYSKFGIGVTDLLVQGEEHCLIKEDDCIGILPRSGATADDIPHLKPNGDRVLLKVSTLALLLALSGKPTI